MGWLVTYHEHYSFAFCNKICLQVQSQEDKFFLAMLDLLSQSMLTVLHILKLKASNLSIPALNSVVLLMFFVRSILKRKPATPLIYFWFSTWYIGLIITRIPWLHTSSKIYLAYIVYYLSDGSVLLVAMSMIVLPIDN